MPRYEDLPGGLKVQITTLFTPRNYCFCTSEGARSPTFYFAAGGLAQLTTAVACGRVRTMHGHGPLLDITTSSKRHFFFVNLADRDAVHGILGRMSGAQRTNGDARFFMDLVGRVYRTAPLHNDYHLEYTVPTGQPNHITRRHASGGRVRVAPRVTQQNVIRLIDRMLADNCAVEVDSVAVVAAGAHPVRAAVSDPATYLAGL